MKKQASDMLNDMYMEKQAIAFSGKKIKDVKNGKRYENEDTVKDVGGNAALYGASKLMRKKAPILSAAGTIMGLTGVGAGAIKRVKSEHNKKKSQHKQASDVLNEMYMEKQAIAFSGKKIEDIKNGENYEKEDAIKDVGGNAALYGASKLMTKKAPILSAAGTIMGLTGVGAGAIKHFKSENNKKKSQHKQASDVLNELYLEKQASIVNTPRLHY